MRKLRGDAARGRVRNYRTNATADDYRVGRGASPTCLPPDFGPFWEGRSGRRGKADALKSAAHWSRVEIASTLPAVAAWARSSTSLGERFTSFSFLVRLMRHVYNRQKYRGFVTNDPYSI